MFRYHTKGWKDESTTLGVDSPFFSAIVLFKNQPFPRVFGGFLERFGSLERLELEVTPGSNPRVFPGSSRPWLGRTRRRRLAGSCLFWPGWARHPLC